MFSRENKTLIASQHRNRETKNIDLGCWKRIEIENRVNFSKSWLVYWLLLLANYEEAPCGSYSWLEWEDAEICLSADDHSKFSFVVHAYSYSYLQEVWGHEGCFIMNALSVTLAFQFIWGFFFAAVTTCAAVYRYFFVHSRFCPSNFPWKDGSIQRDSCSFLILHGLCHNSSMSKAQALTTG